MAHPGNQIAIRMAASVRKNPPHAVCPLEEDQRDRWRLTDFPGARDGVAAGRPLRKTTRDRVNRVDALVPVTCNTGSGPSVLLGSIGAHGRLFGRKAVEGNSAKAHRASVAEVRDVPDAGKVGNALGAQ